MPKLLSKSLTDVAVRKAQPRKQRYDIYDASLRGFGLRVAVSGTKTWYVMRRINGRMVRHTIGRYPQLSLAEARIIATKALKLMASGESPHTSRGEPFQVVLEEWFIRDQAKNRSINTVRNALTKHALPKLRDKPIKAIRKADIFRLIDKISDSGAPVQANRVMAYLHRFFNWCIERDLINNNPAAGIKPPAPEISRERVLTIEELNAVLEAAVRIGYPWGPMVQMLVLTGQRLTEVSNTTWDEIDLENGEWTLTGTRTKNGRPHIIHLSKVAIAVIKEIPRVKDQHWLFTTTGKGPIRGFSKAKRKFDKESHISGWTFHDLRRSFATHTTEKLNISPVVVDKVLNHSSGTVKGIAAVYQRGEYIRERRKALDAWGDFLMQHKTPHRNVIKLAKL